MATENEASCENDPNFAVICSFLEKFGSTCGIPDIDFLDLQEMLENTQEVATDLIGLHIKLLRKTRRSVNPQQWERALIKLCHTFSSQDAWELERFGYKKARLSTKLQVLKKLLEMQFDLNAKFKTEVNKLTAKELRLEPLGRDKAGNAYWYQCDEQCQIRIYKEDMDEETWVMVAKNRDELVKLINQLSDNEESLEPVLNDDSNSLEIEKPITDTGQVTTTSSSQEDSRSTSPKSTGVTGDEETQDVKENLKTTEPIATTIARVVEEVKTETAKKEEQVQETTQPIKKAEVQQVEPSIKTVVGIKGKYFRNEAEKVSGVVGKAVKSAGYGMEDDAGDEEQDEDEAELKVLKMPRLDRPTLLGPKKPVRDESSEEEVEEEEEFEEDEEDVEEEEEVGEEIEEPVMIVKGAGSGRDCKQGNTAVVCQPVPEVSEAIEEPVMYFYGFGNGADCQTGNDGSADDNKDAQQQQQSSEKLEGKLATSCDETDRVNYGKSGTVMIDFKTDKNKTTPDKSPIGSKKSRWDIRKPEAEGETDTDPVAEEKKTAATNSDGEKVENIFSVFRDNVSPVKKPMFFFGPGCVQFSSPTKPTLSVDDNKLDSIPKPAATNEQTVLLNSSSGETKKPESKESITQEKTDKTKAEVIEKHEVEQSKESTSKAPSEPSNERLKDVHTESKGATGFTHVKQEIKEASNNQKEVVEEKCVQRFVYKCGSKEEEEDILKAQENSSQKEVQKLIVETKTDSKDKPAPKDMRSLPTKTENVSSAVLKTSEPIKTVQTVKEAAIVSKCDVPETGSAGSKVPVVKYEKEDAKPSKQVPEIINKSVVVQQSSKTIIEKAPPVSPEHNFKRPLDKPKDFTPTSANKMSTFLAKHTDYEKRPVSEPKVLPRKPEQPKAVAEEFKKDASKEVPKQTVTLKRETVSNVSSEIIKKVEKIVEAAGSAAAVATEAKPEEKKIILKEEEVKKSAVSAASKETITEVASKAPIVEPKKIEPSKVNTLTTTPPKPPVSVSKETPAETNKDKKEPKDIAAVQKAAVDADKEKPKPISVSKETVAVSSSAKEVTASKSANDAPKPVEINKPKPVVQEKATAPPSLTVEKPKPVETILKEKIAPSPAVPEIKATVAEKPALVVETPKPVESAKEKPTMQEVKSSLPVKPISSGETSTPVESVKEKVTVPQVAPKVLTTVAANPVLTAETKKPVEIVKEKSTPAPPTVSQEVKVTAKTNVTPETIKPVEIVKEKPVAPPAVQQVKATVAQSIKLPVEASKTSESSKEKITVQKVEVAPAKITTEAKKPAAAAEAPKPVEASREKVAIPSAVAEIKATVTAKPIVLGKEKITDAPVVQQVSKPSESVKEKTVAVQESKALAAPKPTLIADTSPAASKPKATVGTIETKVEKAAAPLAVQEVKSTVLAKAATITELPKDDKNKVAAPPAATIAKPITETSTTGEAKLKKPAATPAEKMQKPIETDKAKTVVPVVKPSANASEAPKPADSVKEKVSASPAPKDIKPTELPKPKPIAEASKPVEIIVKEKTAAPPLAQAQKPAVIPKPIITEAPKPVESVKEKVATPSVVSEAKPTAVPKPKLSTEPPKPVESVKEKAQVQEVKPAVTLKSNLTSEIPKSVESVKGQTATLPAVEQVKPVVASITKVNTEAAKPLEASKEKTAPPRTAEEVKTPTVAQPSTKETLEASKVAVKPIDAKQKVDKVTASTPAAEAVKVVASEPTKITIAKAAPQTPKVKEQSKEISKVQEVKAKPVETDKKEPAVPVAVSKPKETEDKKESVTVTPVRESKPVIVISKVNKTTAPSVAKETKADPKEISKNEIIAQVANQPEAKKEGATNKTGIAVKTKQSVNEGKVEASKEKAEVKTPVPKPTEIEPESDKRETRSKRTRSSTNEKTLPAPAPAVLPDSIDFEASIDALPKIDKKATPNKTAKENQVIFNDSDDDDDDIGFAGGMNNVSDSDDMDAEDGVESKPKDSGDIISFLPVSKSTGVDKNLNVDKKAKDNKKPAVEQRTTRTRRGAAAAAAAAKTGEQKTEKAAEEKKQPLIKLSCVDINKLKKKADSPKPIIIRDDDDDVDELPETDPLACTEADLSQKDPLAPQPITLATFQIDTTTPPPVALPLATRKRGRPRAEAKETKEIVQPEKRPRLRGRRGADVELRKSIEEKRNEIVSSEDDASRAPPVLGLGSIEPMEDSSSDVVVPVVPTRGRRGRPKKIKEAEKVVEMPVLSATFKLEDSPAVVSSDAPSEDVEPSPKQFKQRGRKKKRRGPFAKKEPADSNGTAAAVKAEDDDSKAEKKSTIGRKQSSDKESPIKEEKVKSETKSERKRRKKLMGLDIPENFNEMSNSLEPNVRQSRRIAQLKIREEAERRKLEEIALTEMKEEQRKKSKDKDKSYTVSGIGPKSEKRKRNKKHVEEEEEVESSQEEYEVESKKTKKKKKHKDMGRLFDESNPWKTSSDDSSEENVDEEEEEIIEDDEELCFKSDHEFSPESDLEGGDDVQPTKRARTAKKETPDEVKEEEDDYACQKCGKNDHPEFILLCDGCDCGWHCSCLKPALFVIPEGDWYCPPCQHKTLVEMLKTKLSDLDKALCKRDMEVRRKERLAYVGISLDNVLPSSKEPNAEPHHHHHQRKQRRSRDDDDESGSESESESGSDSASSSDESDEPVYQLRERRQAHSYRFNDYDDLINSAIQDEMEEVKGAGNQGRGKDIDTIINAEKEEKEAQLKMQKQQQQQEQEGDDAKGAENGEAGIEEEEPLPRVVPVNTSVHGSEDSDDEPLKISRKKVAGRKKHRKLNSLDVSSGDDDNSDEDFKGSSSDEEDEDFDDDGTDSSDMDTRRGRRRGDYGPVRRSTRARTTRYDREFINDDSDDDDAPRKKKTRSVWDESESEESDKSWGRRKRKSSGRRIQSSYSKSKKSKKKKKRRGDDSDVEVYKNRKPKQAKIKYGGLDDEDVDGEIIGRRTRGKKINFLEALGSDSDDAPLKPSARRDEESSEEYVAPEEEDDYDGNDKGSSGSEGRVVDPFNPKAAFTKSAHKKGRGKSGLKRAFAKTAEQGIPVFSTSILKDDSVSEEQQEQQEQEQPKTSDQLQQQQPTSLPQQPQVLEPIIPTTVIQEQPPQTVLTSRIVPPPLPLHQQLHHKVPAQFMSSEDDDNELVEEEEEEDDGGIEALNRNLEDLNEEEMQKMMEEEDFANKHLEMVAAQIAKEKKRKERENKKLELGETETKVPKKRGRKPKSEMLAQLAATAGPLAADAPPPMPLLTVSSMQPSSLLGPNADLSEPPMSSGMPPLLDVAYPADLPKKRRGRGKGKKTLAAEAAAAAALVQNTTVPDAEEAQRPPPPVVVPSELPTVLSSGKLTVAAPPQPFAQTQPNPSVITRMLQPTPPQQQQQPPPPLQPQPQPPYPGPPGQAKYFPGVPCEAPRGPPPPRGPPFMPQPPQVPPQGMYPVMRGTPPTRMRSPGPPNMSPMYHAAGGHHPMDPSPSGGGQIQPRDRNSPALAVPTAAGSPLSATPKGAAHAPSPPPYSRALPIPMRQPQQHLGYMQHPSPPQPPRAGGNYSPYHHSQQAPPPPPNYYSTYPHEEPAMGPAPGPYPQQYPDQPFPPQGGGPQGGGDDETGGEFGGLVSYFSSQREDDLDS